MLHVRCSACFPLWHYIIKNVILLFTCFHTLLPTSTQPTSPLRLSSTTLCSAAKCYQNWRPITHTVPIFGSTCWSSAEVVWTTRYCGQHIH
ncbi:hypothetical protein PF002_g30671 [Phytophthora fragariae]|uniref:Secreted protein n=1 Tax=Phytophthora fragariae TaxID=53985 RepID=A0A6A3GVJ0_9STRA|nr:hypothetical protein PF011_g29923 [Phytophthora fragariae]KAE9066199.1 hypothetical protein PF006_g30296 [Phytophthora fragariae]KAE9168207.1 hypothetical protein PF002_g30671 [Phytophthora fragariae]